MQRAISATRSGCCRCIGISQRRSRTFRGFMESGRQLRRMVRTCVLIILASAFFLVFAVEHTNAHKPVTSKYDYNRNIFPLLRDHCTPCHVGGGPAPMPLMTYNDAVPWAEAI